MEDELIDKELTPQEEQDVLNAIHTIKNILLPKSVALTPKQRKIPHTADDRETFCSKSINYVEDDPSLLPPKKNLTKVKRDKKYSSQLSPILAQIRILEEIVSDTLIATQADEYSFGLGTYKTAKYKTNMGIAGYDSVVEDLGSLFKGQKVKKKKHTPPTEEK
jgi:hypothetical protein